MNINPDTSPSVRLSAALVGPLVALVFAVATSSVRGQVGASNVGIALAIVVVIAALISRAAGLVTAGVAALSFNFFHTTPYHSLRVTDSSDVVIIALLAALGLVVSDFNAWRGRREALADRRRMATGAPQQLTEILLSERPVEEVWPEIALSIMDQLSLADCRFVSSTTTELPVIARAGAQHARIDDSFVLPSQGAAMPVISEGRVLGHLILRPKHGLTSLWVERRVALALADHLAIALTYPGVRPVDEQVIG